MRSFLSASISTLLVAGLTVNPQIVQAQTNLGNPVTPIQHLVVIFGENISFDHYFGTYPNALNPPGQPPFHPAPNTPSVNGLAPALLTDNPNLNPANGTGAANPFRLDRSQALTADMNHSYGPEQAAFDNGAMDLFPKNTGAAGAPPNFYPPVVFTKGLVMGYYDGNTVTAMWNYAQNFAMDDNAFTSTFGPSTPGVLEVVSGQTNGISGQLNGPSSASVSDGNVGLTLVGDADPLNDVCSGPTKYQVQLGGKSIGDLLNSAGISWGGFMGGFSLTTVNPNGSTGCNRSTVSPFTHLTEGDYVPHHAFFQYFASVGNPMHTAPASPMSVGLSSDPANHQYDINDFYAAVAAGNFPAVSYLKAPSYQDAHPGNSNPLDEQQFIVHVINFLQQQNAWANTAVIVTYDDSDGWYDHQMAPIVNGSATSQDALNGPGVCGNSSTALPGVNPATLHAQGRCGYGTRIPFLVISPWAKSNFVDHTLLDQSSVVRFIEDNWLGGQRLGGGSFDSIAGSIMGMFNFNQSPNPKLNFERNHGSCAVTISIKGSGITRRDFLIAGGAAVMAPMQYRNRMPKIVPDPPLLKPEKLTPFVERLPVPPIARSTGKRSIAKNSSHQLPHYRVPIGEIQSKVHPEVPPTRFWAYGNSVPGPTIETRSGQGVLIECPNQLPPKHFLPIDHKLMGAEANEPDVRTVVHLHGAKAPPTSDGNPEHWYTPGKSAVYHYPNEQDAALLWYHDHAMGINRLNIYAGMLGLFIVRDPIEDAFRLPAGQYEIPLVIFDRMIRADGQLYYPVSQDPAAPWVPEVFGNAFLINGKLLPYLEAKPCKYRFRILNAANGRFYHLSLADGQSFHQIGTDQGLLPAPVEVKRLALAPGERADVIVDFADHKGEQIVFQNDLLPIMQIRVGRESNGDDSVLPQTLRPLPTLSEAAAVKTRILTLEEYDNVLDKPMTHLLNGARWHSPITEKPVLGTTEIWSFANMTDDVHPIHLHLVRFQILDRRPFDVSEYLYNRNLQYVGEALAPEPSEAGWKDTVRATPGAVTRIIVPFEGYAGRYVWHCHILEHEDNEMMRPYEVLPVG